MKPNRLDNGSHMNANFMKIPIGYLLRFGEEFMSADIYIKLGDEKFLKLTLKDEAFTETVDRYQKKGLQEVYLAENDFRNIFVIIKNKLSSQQFYDPATTHTQKIELLQNSFNIAREFLEKIGVDEEVIDVCKNINIQALRMVKEHGNVFKFFTEFKNHCNEEFLKSILTSHLVILMIEKFMWRSATIKEKATLACLLCDVTLKREDFDYLHNQLNKGESLPDHILKHPVVISAMLASKKNYITQETLTIIEQHHEMPDGSGFPHKLNHQRITPLSAIYIVASKFMDELIASKFNYEKRVDILNNLYSTYNIGVFGKAYDALDSVVNA